ncbi:MAG: hypothetical protein IT233_12275 [Bacteroidia bacterium]|nr:hypothetical protein [Bacteroidia bacterium]
MTRKTKWGLNVKNIGINVSLIASYLLFGYIFRDFIAIFSSIIFIFLLITKKTEYLLLFLGIVFCCVNFFVGQNYIQESTLTKVLINPKLFLFIVLIAKSRVGWYVRRFDKMLLAWTFIHITIVTLSDVYNDKINLNVLLQPAAVYAFLILRNIHIENKTGKVIDFLVAVGIIQIVISFMQFSEIIDAPMTIMEDGEGYFLWTAGLDDAASGTFGAACSSLTSWFCSALFLTLLAIGITISNHITVWIGLFFLMHYAFIDSKTALGVSIAMTVFFIIRLIRKGNLKHRYYFVIPTVIIGIAIMSYAIDKYYTSIGTKEDYKELVTKSISGVTQHYKEWGKIVGFVNITEEHLREDPMKILLGYGRGNYRYNGNMGRIEAMDTPVMQYSNFTRSRSSLISSYAQIGICGLISNIFLLILVIRYIKSMKFHTYYGASFLIVFPVIIISTIIFMFLYSGIQFNDIFFVYFLCLAGSVCGDELNRAKAF